MKTNQPKVFLYSSTPMPHKNIGLAVSAWHSDDFRESMDEMSTFDAHNLTEQGIKAYHKVALEYVDTVWVIKNVSRAFQQQLTRTRLAAYSIQSMRVISKEGFATGGRYTMPPNLTELKQLEFHKAMLEIERRYDGLLQTGMKTEDARGILPLNIHSDISMHINLSALTHMLTQRFCVLAQWEFRQVATQMANLVRFHMGNRIGDMFDAPCVKAKKCPMREEYCGTPVWKLTPEERIDFYANYVPAENVKI